jgi:hypothetical protein
MPEVLGRINPDLQTADFAENYITSVEEEAMAVTALEGRLGRIRQNQPAEPEALKGTYLVALDNGKTVAVSY